MPWGSLYTVRVETHHGWWHVDVDITVSTANWTQSLLKLSLYRNVLISQWKMVCENKLYSQQYMYRWLWTLATTSTNNWHNAQTLPSKRLPACTADLSWPIWYSFCICNSWSFLQDWRNQPRCTKIWNCAMDDVKRVVWLRTSCSYTCAFVIKQ